MKEVKIGIVLPEDGREEISFTTPYKPLYHWESQGILYPLQKATSYTIRKGSAQSLLLFSGLNCLCKGQEKARIFSLEPFSIAAESCLEVKNILAGRNFHWRKEIHQKLPGHLSVSLDQGNMVLLNLLPLEAYIACVAVSEMSPECPEALLQAQMIVARSWFLAHAENKHPGWDACNDDCCQRYQGVENLHESLIPIALSTEGEVLVYENKICDTRYSKCCGGIAEDASHVWQGTSYPYLPALWDSKTLGGISSPPDMSSEEKAIHWIQSSPPCFCSPDVLDPKSLSQYLGKVDITQNYYRWEKQYSQQEILDLLQKKGKIQNIKEVLSLQPLERGQSARIKRLGIHYLNELNQKQTVEISGEYNIRHLLHPSFLYSSAFFLIEERDSQNHIFSLTLKGAGWGHGSGLCQMGALGMALQGYSYQDILSHYFPFTQRIKI